MAPTNGMRPCSIDRPRAVRVPERDGLVVAERRAEERAHADVVALRVTGSVNCRPAGSAVERSATSRLGVIAAPSDGERLRGEVAAPAADARERGSPAGRGTRTSCPTARCPTGEAPRVGCPGTRRAARRAAPGRAARDPPRGRTTPARRSAPRRAGRAASVERYVTAKSASPRLATRNVAAIAAWPGIARERRGGEPQRDRPAPAGAAERAQRRREQARRDDRGREDDQRGHEQQEGARAAAAASSCCDVDRAARPADEHDGDRAERRGVERRHREPAELNGGRPHGRVEQQPRGDGDAGRGERGRRGESSACSTTSPTGEPAREATSAATRSADRPAGDGARRGERQRLGERVQLDLPAARAEPDQPPARVRDVAAQRGRREDREREQQRAALAAEQQQPARGGGRRRCRGRELRRSARSPGTRRSSPRSPPSAAAPCCRNASIAHGCTSPLPDRHEPARRSGRTSRARCCREAGDAVRDHDRRRLRRVVANGLRDHLRRRRRQHERRERRVGLQRPRARPRSAAGAASTGSGRCPASRSTSQCVGRQALRQAARDELDVAAEVVGGAQVDEALLDRRLAEEHRGGGPLAGDRPHARDDEPVEPARSLFVAPLQATCTSRSAGASCAVACASARSCMTSRPASTAASTAAPATTPTATSSSRSPPHRDARATRRSGNTSRRSSVIGRRPR